MMTGGMGFVQPTDKPADKLDGKVERTAQEAATTKFSPEFMNRLDKVVVFHPLRHEQLEQILEIELGMVQRRVLDTARGQFLFRVTPAAQEHSAARGNRSEIRRAALEARDREDVVYPLANLLATEQVRLGDMLCIDWDEERPAAQFEKEGEGAVDARVVATRRRAGARAPRCGKRRRRRPRECRLRIPPCEHLAPVSTPHRLRQVRQS